MVKKEDISKTLSRLIDNSINARKDITKIKNPCIVKIQIHQDYISISDNSGGINNNITASEIFKIEYTNKDKKSGIGMKRSLFILGDTINIISNKKDCSRRFYIDMTINSEEVLYNSENIEYNKRKEEGTYIEVKNLDENIKLQLEHINSLTNKLGRIYSKFIENGYLIISVNDCIVNPVEINATKIKSCEIDDKYKLNLYRGGQHEPSGVEVFINDYMLYNRDVGKKEANLSSLRHPKHSYRNCIVEILYSGNESEFEKDKNRIFKEVKSFIKENKDFFRSQTTRVQFDVPIEEVEELKVHFNEDSATALGKKAFYKMYSEYIDDMNKRI